MQVKGRKFKLFFLFLKEHVFTFYKASIQSIIPFCKAS